MAEKLMVRFDEKETVSIRRKRKGSKVHIGRKGGRPNNWQL